MPREFTHWEVLKRAKSILETQDSPNLSRCINENQAASLLGAMAHDAPYYYRLGGHNFEKVSMYLHGHFANDTLDPIRALARQNLKIENKESRELFWSFLIGMLSHYVTDATFHPMINFMTGNYYARDSSEQKLARARHRVLEVYIDSWVKHKFEFSHALYFNKMSSEIGVNFSNICKLMDFVLSPEKLMGLEPVERLPRWKSAFSYMGNLQKLFLSPAAGIFISSVNRLSFGKLKGIEALFTFKRDQAESCLNEEIGYRNPVSGEERVESLEQLLDRAAKETLRLALLFEPLISGELGSGLGELEKEKGLSLNFGLYQVSHKEASFYSDKGFDLPGLR